MLFIIFGTRGVTTTTSRGSFYCPSCAAASPYKHVTVRRFFTLYFIPLIPLDLVGEYIECEQCRNTFNESVLSYDPEKEQRAFRAGFEVALSRVLIYMMLADGDIEDAE